MKGRDIARLSCRILAVYSVIAAIQSVNYLTVLFDVEHRTGTLMMIMAVFTPFILLLALGFTLWTRADILAEHMVKGGDLNAGDLKVSSQEVQAIAFSAVGALVLADAAPNLLSFLFNLVMMHSYEYFTASGLVNIHTASSAIKLAVQLLIGTWLLLGSRGIVAALKKLREAGLRDAGND